MSGARPPSELEVLVDWLKALGPRSRGAGMAAAAQAVGEVARLEHAGGHAPDGAAWPRRKVDGAVPLQRPTSEIAWSGKRGAIRATADDVLTFHRRRRPVFPPSGRLPPTWRAAAERALRRVLEKGAPS